MSFFNFPLGYIANLTLLHRCHAIHTLLLVGWMLICCADAESITLIKRPHQISSVWSWSWAPTGADRPPGATTAVERWKNTRNVPPQYLACETSLSTQPDQWLTSEAISIGPANRIDVTIEYAMSNCSAFNLPYCRHNYSLYIHMSATKLGSSNFPDPYTRNHGAFEKIGTSSPRELSTGQITQKAENTETFPVITDAAKPYLNLAFHYQGGCVALFTVSVHYYYCPAISLSSSLVQLPQTTAPANGSVQVKGSCNAQHTKPLTNESDLYGYCKDNGEWSTDGECGCDYGYGKVVLGNGGSECRECPLRTYKNKVSNSNCTACPRNSIQDINRTSCYCDTGFYRTEEENEFSSCSGQPSTPLNLAVASLNASFVSVAWNPPSDDGGRSDLYYTVECYQCNDEGTDCTRECTGSDITVNQNSRRASIKSLSAYTYYMLKVYAKNGISKLAEKNKEKAKHADVKLRTNDSIPGSPVVTVKQLSPTLVSLSWEVREKNGIITYYQVSYYPVDQPSNVKKFNTNSTSAIITGLKTGKEYRFEVRASSRLGLGPPVIQTKKVVENTGDKPNIDVTVPVLGALVGILFLIGAVVAIVYFARRKRRTSSPDDQKQTDKFALSPTSRNYGSPFIEGFDHVQELCDKETPESRDDLYMVVTEDTLWEIPRENISVIKRLGSGNFGYVDKALAIGLPGLPGQVMVAVKSLKGRERQGQRGFLTELNLMMKLAPHRHVVRLYGCCTKPGGPQSIILEYLPYGDLLGYLRRSRGHEDSYCSGDLRPESSLKSRDLLKFGWMIADGMEFLAENKCVHRDLAARNVLVGENKVCKISDLGLARKISEDIYTRSSEARLPVKWMPPESLFFGQSTIASDVWSYGIVLWELFTLGDSPYPGCKGKDVLRLLREGYRMPKPAHLSETLYSLMMRCWKERPEDRPTFSLICEEVNSYYKATEDYINLEVFDDRLYVNFDVL